jgi:hypothetical protein
LKGDYDQRREKKRKKRKENSIGRLTELALTERETKMAQKHIFISIPPAWHHFVFRKVSISE